MLTTIAPKIQSNSLSVKLVEREWLHLTRALEWPPLPAALPLETTG